MFKLLTPCLIKKSSLKGKVRQVVRRSSGASLGAAGRLPAVGSHYFHTKDLVLDSLLKAASVRFRLPAPRWLEARHMSGAQA